MIIFILLNLLDSVITCIGLKMGLLEGNPFYNWLFGYDMYLGLTIKMFLSAIIGVLLAVFKPKLLHVLNIIFSVIVILNIINVLIFWLI